MTGRRNLDFILVFAHEIFDGVGGFQAANEFCRHLAAVLDADCERSVQDYAWGEEVNRLALAMPLRSKEPVTEMSHDEKIWVDGMGKYTEDTSVSPHSWIIYYYFALMADIFHG